MKNERNILRRMDRGTGSTQYHLKSAELHYKFEDRHDLIRHGISVLDTLIALLNNRGISRIDHISNIERISRERNLFKKALKGIPNNTPLYGKEAIEMNKLAISITHFSYYVEGLDIEFLRQKGYADDLLSRVSSGLE